LLPSLPLEYHHCRWWITIGTNGDNGTTGHHWQMAVNGDSDRHIAIRWRNLCNLNGANGDRH
jgi:hypothetical protein